MPSLKEVRNRINSIKSTQQITKAMKMVAAAKLRKSQDNILQMRPYSKRLQGILDNVLASVEEMGENPLATERPVNHVLIVVVTSDRGLCGSFNTNVIKGVLALINEKYAAQHRNGNLHLMCIGRKGRDFFKRRNYKVIEDYTEILNRLSFDLVRNAAEYAMNGFKEKQFDVVEIVYNEFKNVATQIMRSQVWLPLAPSATGQAKPANQSSEVDYIYEPSKLEIIEELIPKTLKVQFYKALLESNASEHGARMTAMDKATENAGDILRELRLVYNRSRQAAITKEILEIVGGAEALANG